MRAVVLTRDGGCVAQLVDPGAGPCYDQWGAPLRNRMTVELDYIRLGARGAHHELSSDHVALCAGHHRGTGPQGGYVWATAHRPELRAYLARVAKRGLTDGTNE